MQNNIKQIRKARGLTLEALAERLSSTKQHIGRLEKSKRLTTLWLERFAKALDCSVQDIIGEAGEPILEFTSDETKLVLQYRALSPDLQLALRTIAASRAPAAAAGEAIARSANFEFLLSALQEAMKLEGLPSLSTGTALRLMGSIADELGIQIEGLGEIPAGGKAPGKARRRAA